MNKVYAKSSECPRSAGRILAGLALAAWLLPTTASAQQWSGGLKVYGWLPWMDASTTTDGGLSPDISTSFAGDDVLEALDFTVMGSGEIHYDRFGLLFDIVYAKLSADGQLSGPLSSDISIGTKLLLLTTAIGYQAYVEDGKLIEPYAGARYVGFDTNVSIDGGGPIGLEKSASKDIDWWDPVIGVRGSMPITEDISLGGFADVGGFGVGSQFSWEIFAGLDYAITDSISGSLGFRYLSIDYENDGDEVKLDTYGPVLGLTMHF